VAKATTLDRLRALCLAYPETTETSSWGHPNFKAGKKVFVAFEQVKGRPSMAFRLVPSDVERLLMRMPFFVTPYGRGQWVSLWADGAVDWKAVTDLVDRSYRVVAQKRMIAALDASTVQAGPKTRHD
jgi:predicted DNA-binding protein (MmcQ/YjbR family)